MSEPTTSTYAYDTHGNLVISQPIGASNDVIHVGAIDQRIINSSRKAVRGGPLLPSGSDLLTARHDFSVLAANKDQSSFTVIAASKAPPAEQSEPQVLI